MTAQQSQQRAPHAPARDESASAGGHPHGTPPMSELLASCAAAAAVSSPPSDAGTPDEETGPAERAPSADR
ncbi:MULTISPECIES: hypothetical protein [Streptomyces]|uniref:Uncharacterized protein n=1 Tax=Streptomyces qinglanensis TaxID=943816 RepID=A0A1E7K9X5_9ACTN|nr:MULTISPECIES: hypothetical protein [Streptomyces]OEV00735.1 hypothetical protein AN217_26370 [Streptomyces qinglanensis]OEV07442.1 hypothetical protein AN220_34210 [Streptomyces nanshensis]